MLKREMGLVLAAAALLAGCSLGDAAKPGIEGRIQEAQRSLGTNVEVATRQALKSGAEVAIFSYKKGSTCGAGAVDAATIVTMEGECAAAISPGQSTGDDRLIVYGYLPQGAGVAKVLLQWEDGVQAEAVLTKSAFYYIAEAPNLPKGQVRLTAYDKDGKVVQEAPPPGQHHHSGH